MKTISYYKLDVDFKFHYDSEVFNEIGLFFETPQSALERFKSFLETCDDKNWYVKVIVGARKDVEFLDLSLNGQVLEFTYNTLDYNEPPKKQQKTVIVDGETYVKEFTQPYEKQIVGRMKMTTSIWLYQTSLELR